MYSKGSSHTQVEFLTAKEAAELQPMHFATGDDFDYDRDQAMNEFVRALEALDERPQAPIIYDMR